MDDKCTCVKCGAKSLYIQFFQINGRHYCRMCYTDQLQQAREKVINIVIHRMP